MRKVEVGWAGDVLGSILAVNGTLHFDGPERQKVENIYIHSMSAETRSTLGVEDQLGKMVERYSWGTLRVYDVDPRA